MLESRINSSVSLATIPSTVTIAETSFSSSNQLQHTSDLSWLHKLSKIEEKCIAYKTNTVSVGGMIEGCFKLERRVKESRIQNIVSRIQCSQTYMTLSRL